MRRKGEIWSNGESSRGRSLKEERESLVVWRRPVRTVDYFVREVWANSVSVVERTLGYRKTLGGVAAVAVACAVALNTTGPHQEIVAAARTSLGWCLYWLGLGVLSSIGLGTGLHTFLLYLGPHIAAVTIAAYECGGLNFPRPPYPDDIVCPDEVDPAWVTSVWNIMRKVHLEAVMWGAGTALGELPPYFMARAARLSGDDATTDDGELREFEELQRKKKHPESLDLLDEAKLLVERLVNRVGFLGIALCASIPNPLFDLAGITCGHFLVPFWTFFGATLLGKAVVKMTLQGMFVIVAFSDVLVDSVMLFVGRIPVVGLELQSFLQKILALQRERLHRDARSQLHTSSNPVAMVFEMFVIVMVGYFLVSIVNSLAQNYHKRLHRSSTGKKHWND